MWRPKDGFERRFEIQRKEDYEREEMEREKEREREGENYQGTSMTQQTGMVVCKGNHVSTSHRLTYIL